MDDSAVIDRLDRVLAVLQLAHHDAITEVSARIRADKVNAEILDACADDWVASGDLTTTVVRASKANARTVQRRLATLVAQRALLRRGPSNAGEYRSTGLI